MMMRKMFQQGTLFRLDSQLKNQDSSQKSVQQLQSFESNYTQEDLQSIRIKQQQKKLLQLNQNMMAMICAGLFFLVTTFGGMYLFYYLFFDYVKQYVPFLQTLKQKQLFLSQLTAKQYFEKFPVRAGQIHYPRIPIEYCEHSFQLDIIMGLNSLSVYVFWNYHQIQKGRFDFQSGNKNLTHFLELAKKHNMRVLIRPGPYVCAQWDFGGLPARLLSIRGIQIRSSNQLFIQQTALYLNQLYSKVLKPFIANQNNPSGNIIMIQLQNQPGWFTKQIKYIQKLKQIWDKIDPGCPLYYDDNENFLANTKMYWDNAILGINSEIYKKQNMEPYKQQHAIIAGEVYSGWFTQWGMQNYQTQISLKYQDNFINQFNSLLKQNKSFSMYMAHGGTNFGLTAGYNLVTSYDYFSPINQRGYPTEKYHTFRSIFADNINQTLSKIPKSIDSMSLTLGKILPISSLFDNLKEPLIFKSSINQPLLFESQQLKMFNQGLVLYQIFLQGPTNYTFEVKIHDLAFIYFNGQYQQTIQRLFKRELNKKQNLNVNCVKNQCKLQILVQAMGHVNFGKQMKQDKKGILQFKRIKENGDMHQLKLKWNYYIFDVRQQPAWVLQNKCQKSPCLYYIQTQIRQPKDTYLILDKFEKGYIWVNGHNLGRYWNVGPQNKLYCPGVWLHQGKNKIIILDLLKQNGKQILKGDKQLYQRILY